MMRNRAGFSLAVMNMVKFRGYVTQTNTAFFGKDIGFCLFLIQVRKLAVSIKRKHERLRRLQLN